MSNYKKILLFAASLLVMVAMTTDAVGQGQYRARRAPKAPRSRKSVQRPTVSNYLNLLNANRTDEGNYYGLVRPQTLQQRQLNLQQTQFDAYQQDVDQQIQGVNDQIMNPTGHASYFRNYLHYFPRKVR